ncbi:hypothetical protein SODALDRAFT_279961, partial [Sodiomyces alkalinus F11]
QQYSRTGIRQHIDHAVSIAQLSVTLVADDDNWAARMNNLGCMLQSRYERTGATADLEEAIGVARQAVEATPDNHPDRATCLNNLGNKLQSRYERTRATADLEEAIGVARQASVEATPDDHPNRAGWLNNLGSVLAYRYERTGATADLEEAIDCFRQTWNLATAIPFRRIYAAIRLLRLYTLRTNFDEAIRIGKGAIHLLPTVNTKLLSSDDQQHVISTFAGLAASLCSLLLATNQVEEALRYLEEGRAVILSNLLDARSDASVVAGAHPDLAHRFEELRQEINAPLHEHGPAVEREQRISRRRQAILDFEACVQQIRTKPGHERFMMGLTAAEMRRCAAGGSIVVVNVSSFRSDAIIITPTIVKAVPLARLSASDAQKWLGKEWSTKKSQRAKSNKEYLAYLAWLWALCVEQVLNDIRILQGVQGSELPRVWWVGSGLASSMPFHAAGIHRRGSTTTAYHRAISSYAPSIKTLAHARIRADNPKTSGSLLLVTMPTTPAREGEKAPPDLPGVAAEKDIMLGVTKGHLAAEHMEGPSVDDVLGALSRCSVAHFACHGSSDPVDPSQSGLILQRPRDAAPDSAGAAGLVQDRLSVGRMSEVSLRNARLAYLSACSTAQNKSDRLSDEVIHVVSGFQVAGFPHVVGCLWPSNDRTCVEVASRFYSRLFGQESRWRDDTVASALRDAVMEVMEDGELEAPLNWAPYVHYGP